jgi:hypothetical protein
MFAKSEGILFRLPLLLALALAIAPSCSASFLWVDPTGGTLINFSAPADNALATVNAGSFSFPFEGSSYSIFDVSSAGFLWLGGQNGAQSTLLTTQASALQYFNNGAARIAPAWMYLDETVGGQVTYKLVNNPGGSESFVLTYLNVPLDNYPMDAAYYASFQVQLISTGDIVFSYLNFDSNTLIQSNALIGLTPAFNSSSQPVDLASLTPGAPVTTSSSFYDFLSHPSIYSSLLTNQSIVIHPVQNGWQIGPDFHTAEVPEPSTIILSLSAAIALLGVAQKRLYRTKL